MRKDGYRDIIPLMEKWNMNNGMDGFIDFYGNHHPSWRHDEQALLQMVSPDLHDTRTHQQVLEEITDSWIQEQYRRWIVGTDRFVTLYLYHAVDPNNRFYDWLNS